MASYLVKFPEKIEAIVGIAKGEGVDPNKIETAMKPVLMAVEKALAFHKTQTQKGAR
jgi:transcription initiation factor TFIIH subunit 1